MWRHGDVFIERVDSIPDGLQESRGQVLAYGEITGHSHRIKEPKTAKFYLGEEGGERFFQILADEGTLVHEEHGPIKLERGFYRSWIQREYHPEEIRRVID